MCLHFRSNFGGVHYQTSEPCQRVAAVDAGAPGWRLSAQFVKMF